MILGIIILVMGIVLILQALGLVMGNFWGIFWGVLFLVIGLKMMSKKKQCLHCDWFHCKKDHKEETEQK